LSSPFSSDGGNLMRALPPGGCTLKTLGGDPLDLTTAAASATLFAPLTLSVNQPSGSLVQTRAPLSGSPAVNAVDCDGQTRDARNVPRPQAYAQALGPFCDIGAYETELDIRILASTTSTFTAGGAAVTYSVHIKNPDKTGTDADIAASGVSFSITLPAQLRFDSLVSASGYSCSTPAMGSSGLIDCIRTGALAVDADEVFTLGAVLDAATLPATNVDISATLSATIADRALADNAVTTSNEVEGFLDLAMAVVRTPSGASLPRGAGVSYAITVTNATGPSTAVGAIFGDTTSLALENLTQTPADTFTLAKGATSTFTVSGNVRTNATATDGPVAYSATVNAAGYTGGSANASDPVPFAIDDTATITSALTASVGATAVVAGESITWTAVRSNNGPALSRNVVSVFTADGHTLQALTLAAECVADKNIGEAGPVVVTCTCDGACVAVVGAEVALATVTFSTASASGGASLLATLDVSGVYDADGATDSEMVDVGRQSALTITAASASGGSVIVRVDNAGPSDADLALAFTLPPGFSLSPASYNGTLQAGASIDLTFVWSATAAAVAGEGSVTASASGAGSVSAVFTLAPPVLGGTGVPGGDDPMAGENDDQAPLLPRGGCTCRGSGLDPSVWLVVAVLLFNRARRRRGS